MEIRQIREEEKSEAIRLDDYCFNHGHIEGRTELFFRERFKPEYSLAVFEEGKLASWMMILPFAMTLRGRWLVVSGLSSVATFPEFRERGYVRKLLFHALGNMRRQGQLLSLLIPFDYRFYQKYGWGTCYQYQNVKAGMDYLKNYSDHGFTFRKLDEAFASDMVAVYKIFSKRYNGMLSHSARSVKYNREWAKLEKFNIYGCFEGETLHGYMVFSVKDKKLEINDLIYDSQRAKSALLHLAYMHRAEAKEFERDYIPEDEIFVHELLSPDAERRLLPGYMGRIVDFIKLVPFFNDGNLNGKLSLKIRDPLAVWNRGVFEIQWNEGKASVKKTKNEDFEIEADISVLSQIIMGFLDARYALDSGLISGSKEGAELLAMAYPKQLNYFNDFF